jgi:uncharacterized RDD family membrane protein YckC
MAKCPKCQYFSFDSGDRCRNCGYDFSFSVAAAPASDLNIHDAAEPLGPLGDFALNEPPGNLPLFTPSRNADAPLVTPSPTPRAPLSVRRGAPTAGRPPRATRARDEIDHEPRLALDTAEIPVVSPPAFRSLASPAPAPTASDDRVMVQTAGTVSRMGAAVIDGMVLGGINVMVLYFTLKICDLTFADVLLLPAAPLLSFLLLLDGSYLAMFVAAGGQTIGKMATGIRVVPAGATAPLSNHVSFGNAIVRAAAFLVCLLPVGLGLLPALFGREHRGLHDRLADTRVIKA